ncbi:signal peptide peptidase SppA [Clostridiales bacterium COT073_COT-073]|nr:signal peptide peptidase SppA [Clostridiales bacterium COT073_COT-073]
MIELLLQPVITAIFITLFVLLAAFAVYNIVKSKGKKSGVSLKKAEKLLFKIEKLAEDEYIEPFGGKDSLFDIIDGLKRLADYENIKEIILDIDHINLSQAHYEELKPLFRELAKTKKISAIATEYNKIGYLTALLADHIYLFRSKSCMMFLGGYSYRTPYLKRVLAKFGLQAEVLHIGTHKSTGEELVLEEMSQEKRESQGRVLEKAFAYFAEEIQRKRNIDIKTALLKGDLIFATAEEAMKYQMIDGMVTLDELGVDLDKNTISWANYLEQYKEKKIKTKDEIAILSLEGEIKEKKKGRKGISYKSVLKKLDLIKEDENVKGLVLRINSPGGSALESEKIYQKLKGLNIPIYVSMGSLCASGGYYIASAGRKLFASPITITGSIGVVLMQPRIHEAMEKMEIKLERIENGAVQDAFDITRPLSEASRQKLIQSMKMVYQEFKDHVLEARNMDDDTLEPLAGGRIWLGLEAKENGLVDEIGGVEDCIASLARELNLDKYKVSVLQEKKSVKDTIKEVMPEFLSLAQQAALEFMIDQHTQILCLEEFDME